MITTLDIILSFIIGSYFICLGFKLIDKDKELIPIAIYALAFSMILYMICGIGIIQKLN